MILLDSTPLIALVEPRDQWHQVAQNDLKKLLSGELLLTTPILTEVCFAVPHHHQRQRLRSLLNALPVRAYAIPDEGLFWQEVFDWLERYGEHQPDWADGCLAVLCGRERQLAIWTYDSEFRTLWRRPDGSAIPMAV